MRKAPTGAASRSRKTPAARSAADNQGQTWDRPRFSQSHGGNPLSDQGRRSFDRLLYRAPRLQARSPGRTGLGLSFRNEIESGPGGKPIQLEDPDGNPIELFQPA